PNDCVAYHFRARNYGTIGKFEKAIADSSRAIALTSKPKELVLFLNDRGVSLAKSGKPMEAFNDYDRALSLDPKLYYAYYNRGWILLNNYSESRSAIADFSKCIELNPEYSLAYFQRAKALWRVGAIHEQVADLNTLAKFWPSDVETYENRAWAHLKLNEY